MAIPVVITTLGAEIGLKLAKKVVESIGARPKAEEGFKQVESMIATGTSALAALQKVFGKDFDSAVAEALGSGANTWTYEAGRSDYILVKNAGRNTFDVLRAELNVNLDRIARTHFKSEGDVRNYFLGVFREWMDRYKLLAGNSEDAESTFKAIDSLLDGKRRTFADVFQLLQKTGLGAVGALLVIQSVLVATSTGVGVVAAISTALFGVPVLQVAVLIVGGALILALSRLRLSSASALSATVAAAYQLLDRSAKRASAGQRKSPEA